MKNKEKKTYSEDELIEMYQNGKIDMLFLVKHHSKRWKRQFEQFCRDNDISENNTSAEIFYENKADELEKASYLVELQS